MYVYIESDGLWTVGFFNPKGEWMPTKDFNSEEGAAALVHYLNGGNE